MLTRLRLARFKNFEDAALSMGPFTLLVGVNASGKSNVREALRFLHGIGRGYSLAEIFDEKWNAGERQWDGLRGGVREAAFRGASSFAIEVDATWGSDADPRVPDGFTSRYRVEIEAVPIAPARVIAESLEGGVVDHVAVAYDSRRAPAAPNGASAGEIAVGVPQAGAPGAWKTRTFSSSRPVLGHALHGDEHTSGYAEPSVSGMYYRLSAMRFVDLDPKLMRLPSTPGQRTLSDRGENLSSVIQAICSREEDKAQILQWIRLLTPMDVMDFRFLADLRGRVLLVLVEKDGTAVSADSASDGTLRFLGMLAVLFSPEPGLVFFEEIENGLHPARLRLLVDLVRSRTREGRLQVVATTHSPTLLASLDDDLLRGTSLVYRLEGAPSAAITRLLDVPDAARVLASHDRADLLASGWFEDMVEFASKPREPAPDAAQIEAKS